MTNLNITLTQDELAEMIVAEVKRVAKRESITSTYTFDASDLEDYVVVRVWEYIILKPSYGSLKGIRQLIKWFVRNFLKSPNNVHTNVDPFSAMANSDDEGNESDFESTYDSGANLLDSDSINCIQVGEFMSTLTSRQLSILTLKTQGYEVNEISAELGVHRNTINNTLKTIKELALDFGLEEL